MKQISFHSNITRASLLRGVRDQMDRQATQIETMRISRLGKGKFAYVFQGEWRWLPWYPARPAALKMYFHHAKSKIFEMARRAYKLVWNLRHPHLIRHDFMIPSRGYPILAMELADGELRGCIPPKPEAGGDDLSRHILEIANTRDFLHHAGVV